MYLNLIRLNYLQSELGDTCFKKIWYIGYGEIKEAH